ncbi:hypothetical protein [Methanosarcina siciliae]|uniref:hypothetical protein n=1 Tax=Methanosarcina siciliae TaxID=38027 RepID=UPI001E2F18FC|nr:hypothetical protein [Methanosarcina siciliae]
MIVFIFILFSCPDHRNNPVRIYAFILLVGIYLFGIHPFAFPNPIHMDIYGYVNNLKQIIDSGDIENAGSYINSYPLASIFYVEIIHIVGTDITMFARFYPILDIFITLNLIFLISYLIIDEWFFLPPLIYLSNSWIPVHYMVPQSFGLFMSILSISLFVRIFHKTENSKNFIVYRLLLIFVLFSLVTSHPTSVIISLFAFSVMFFYFVLSSVVFKEMFYQNKKHMVSIYNIVILFMILYFFHVIYVSKFILLDAIVNTIKTSIFGFLDNQNLLSDIDWTSTTPIFEYVIVSKLRILNLIFVFILGIVSIVFLYISKCRKLVSHIFIGLFLGYSSIIISNILSRQTKFIDRGFIFLLIPFCFLLVLVFSSIKTKKLLYRYKLFLFSIVSLNLIIFPLLLGASFPYQYYSDSELVGKQFIESHNELIGKIKFNFYGSPFVYNNFWYNYISLHHQRGNEYKKSFENSGLLKIYDNSLCGIYYPKNYPNEITGDIFTYWSLTGYRV